MDPLERIPIDQALEHPFFESLPSYINETYHDQIKPLRDKWIDNMTCWEVPPLDKCVESQKDLIDKMRLILISWLVEVCEEYNLSISSYIRAQNIIDRYCAKQSITRGNYQLLGIGALWIAGKIEEVYPASSHDLIYISDKTYNMSQLAQMEKDILKVLDLDIVFPLSIDFISIYGAQIGLSKEQKNEVRFVLIYITFCLDLLKYHPSILCLCACLYVGEQSYMVYDKRGNPYEDDEDAIISCMKRMGEWIQNPRKKSNSLNSLLTSKWGRKYKDKYS